jgi:hypothetical protein
VAHDRAWKGMRTVTLLPDLDPAVDPESLRAALRRLHAVDPTAPAVCRLDGAPLRWAPVPTEDLEAWLERLVVDERGCPPEDPHATVQRLLRQPADETPFRVVLRKGSHIWQVDHVLGDGSHVFRQIIVGLTRSAISGEVPTGLLSGPRRQHPVLRAGWNTFVRQPQLATWRAAVDRWRMPFHGSSAAPAHPDGGAPELATVTRSGVPAALDALRQWRDEHVPGTSVATLTMSVARMALEAEGAVEPGTDSVVMFDARRYLPHGVDVTGNFSAALRLTDPRCADPRRLGEQIRSDMELGLPLVSLLAATAAEALSPALPATARNKGVGPVVLTHLGPLNVLRDLPWTPGEQELIMAAAPSGLSGITVTMTEWRKRMNVTMTSDARFVSQDAVARAATRLVEDPVGVLDSVGKPA